MVTGGPLKICKSLLMILKSLGAACAVGHLQEGHFFMDVLFLSIQCQGLCLSCDDTHHRAGGRGNDETLTVFSGGMSLSQTMRSSRMWQYSLFQKFVYFFLFERQRERASERERISPIYWFIPQTANVRTKPGTRFPPMRSEARIQNPAIP